LLAIESKGEAGRVEINLGDRLKLYVQQLITSRPIITRQSRDDWNLWTPASNPVPDFSILAGGAFLWDRHGASELDRVLARSQLDIVFAVEFNKAKQLSVLHVKAAPSGTFLIPKIRELAERFGPRLKVQIH
jgi:hypothetical protein